MKLNLNFMKKLLTVTFTFLICNVFGQIALDTSDISWQNIEIGGVTDIPRFEFPKEYGNIDDFVKKNLIYPEEAKAINKEGYAGVFFALNKEGKIIDFRFIDSSVYPPFQEEIKRLIALMPMWSPHADFGKFYVYGHSKQSYTFNFNIPK